MTLDQTEHPLPPPTHNFDIMWSLLKIPRISWSFESRFILFETSTIQVTLQSSHFSGLKRRYYPFRRSTKALAQFQFQMYSVYFDVIQYQKGYRTVEITKNSQYLKLNNDLIIDTRLFCRYNYSEIDFAIECDDPVLQRLISIT